MVSCSIVLTEKLRQRQKKPVFNEKYPPKMSPRTWENFFSNLFGKTEFS
jgi:hypothetical protein